MDATHFNNFRQYLSQHIIGQHQLIDSILICLLSDGHILVEGMPGLAKTTAVKSMAGAVEGDFHRIQFTPDLLPADLIGTDIYQHERGEFEFRAGPLFHNILLADEINRAPPKVQSALLEAMGERQITVGQHTYPLPELFMVLATQNPVEHEGTYTLPEAQLDRFLLYVKVGYPNKQEELQVIELMEKQQQKSTSDIVIPKLSQVEIQEARTEVMQLYLDPKLKEYIIDLIQASRYPAKFDD
ncbi:MAG: AAA family ATPase, partial [Candidatus Marithrix sp.]|nr:AAA family ATPase [Candidatus Marithrix sp.]